jgi:hypothetical protein
MKPIPPKIRSCLTGHAVILLAAVVAVAPLLLRGPSCGHDFDFHLGSWLDAANGWRHGILYPHWAASANFGAGEPRFIFYPPLTWMLGAALGTVLPWTLVPAALSFLLLAGTGLATRALARLLLPESAAALAGCAALFSGYALFTTYERTAFGELTGGFWIPLLLLFLLRERYPSHPFRIFSSKSRGMDGAPYGNAGPSTTLRSAQVDKAFNAGKRALDGSAAPLTLVVAGCWLSNLPLGVMACYLLAAVATIAALLTRSWALVVRAALAIALGLGLTAIYLLPALVEQRWVDVRQATDAPGERIENSLLFALYADPALTDHNTVLRKVSFIAVYMIAVALIGVVIVGWRIHGSNQSNLIAPGHEKAAGGPTPPPYSAQNVRLNQNQSFEAESNAKIRRFWLPLALIPLAVLFLQLPPSLPVWNLLPKLHFLQFPWRWLVVLEAPMALFFAAAFWPRRRTAQIAVALLCAAFFFWETAFVARDFYQFCGDSDGVPALLSAFQSGAGVLGADEFTPPDADNALLPSGLPAACLAVNPGTALGVVPADADPDLPIRVWNAAQGTCIASADWLLDLPEHKRLAATAHRVGFLILRLRSYPAWKLALNGQPLSALPQREDGLVAVPVTPGPVDLSADWRTTPDVRAARWLSALCALLLIGLFLLERKLKNSSRPHLL